MACSTTQLGYDFDFGAAVVEIQAVDDIAEEIGEQDDCVKS